MSPQAERDYRSWKLAGAPISWGVCEVPGWGPMLPPERVLSEMRRLGMEATELGPEGYLPGEAGELRELLERFELRLVASFEPVVLHTADRSAALERVDRQTAKLAELGAERILFSPVADPAWSEPPELDERGWDALASGIEEAAETAARNGIGGCIHPHSGSLIESAAEIDRIRSMVDPAWCLDTAHLMVGGKDPLEFARQNAERVVHVHLKDIDEREARRLGRHEITHLEAAEEGAFMPLGRGDASIAAVIRTLEAAGYDGWMTLEQDTSVESLDIPDGEGPIASVEASLEFIEALGHDRSAVA